MKHKHCEIIKAWADGAEIEWRLGPGLDWHITNEPEFRTSYEYRVKPEKKTPGECLYLAFGTLIPWSQVCAKNKSDWEEKAKEFLKIYGTS